ncbi:hypothetical protein GCM10007205_07940 [Oxalicibacterium flavum]|uniref:Rap1a immunity protein domain-containing protein n=2 Tax=Oxalicibacterium flavum TaxID=179467 RepID=A0A8J2UMZ3_9BURK|nr:hypothetical protein GCM10007205_07940 [Oxalicibacterium flavum]
MQMLLVGSFNTFALDGNYYHNVCNAKDAREGICVGFINGFMNGVSAQAYLTKQQKFFCLPEHVTTLQLIDLFKKQLRDEPQIRHLPSEVLFGGLLKDTFPCR